MSIKMENNSIIVDEDIEMRLSSDNSSLFIDVNYATLYALNKSELAQLITALQAMHDKMVDDE